MLDDDSAIVRRMWDAKIPICLNLAQEELASEDRVPLPYYIMAPRVSYFPLILDRVLRYFSEFTEPSSQLLERGLGRGDSSEGRSSNLSLERAASDERHSTPERGAIPGEEIATEAGMEHVGTSRAIGERVGSQSSLDQNAWLECANQPLKWHYPIGLLFDLHSDGMELPWKLTVHFQNYPNDILLAPPVHRRAIEVHLLSTVKEADVLKHRSQVINQMQARDHRQLWTGLLNYQFDQFWSVNRRLMEPVPCPLTETTDSPTRASDADPATPPELDVEEGEDVSRPAPPRSVRAFRQIPCRVYHATVRSGASVAWGYVQKRLVPFGEDGSPVSLIDAMHRLLQPESTAGRKTLADTFDFLLHGIPIPINTPIQWLSEHMSYADNFIHIVAWPRSRPNRMSVTY